MAVRRNRVVLFSIVVMAFAFIGFGLWVPQRVDRKVTIPYSMLKISEMFSNSEYLAKWWLPFAGVDIRQPLSIPSAKKINAGDEFIEITDYSVAGSVLTTGNNDRKKLFVVTITQDPVNRLQSEVLLSYNSTLFKKWFGQGNLEKRAEKSLENLKAYMEDNRRLYGYEIERESVTDTSFLFRRTTVLIAEKQMATKKLFEDLIAYAKEQAAGYTGTRIFYSQKTQDKITLFAGIGITKRLETKIGDVYEYKAMPAGKNLLMAKYQGPFGDAYKAYAALEQYKSDHYLSSMAIPFQKFLNDGYDFAEDQVVQLKVYYPIF